MRVKDLAIDKKRQRIVQVTHIMGRMVLCAWFDGDPEAKDAKLSQGQFWQHQLDFNADNVRALAKRLGLGK